MGNKSINAYISMLWACFIPNKMMAMMARKETICPIYAAKS